MILKAFPGYRKRIAQLCYTTLVSLSGGYWDGGSRKVWATIKNNSAKIWPARYDYPFTDTVTKVDLIDGTIAVSAGTFCGKTAQAYIYMLSPF